MARLRHQPRHAGALLDQSRLCHAHGGGNDRTVPIQGRDARCSGCLLDGRHALLPRDGRCRMTVPGGQQRKSIPTGAATALLSAALFGASTPLAKILVGTIDPRGCLRALFYLGSGIGLSAVRAGLRLGRTSAAPAEVPLCGPGVAVVWRRHPCRRCDRADPAGGGLTQTPAASASLLLNLEGALTALLAWFVF